MLKNDFLAFPKYSGYSLQVRWANLQAVDVKKLRMSRTENNKNRLMFDRVIQNIKGGHFIEKQCRRRYFQNSFSGRLSKTF